MSRETTIVITLVVYKIILVAIGILTSRKTNDTDDFYLGGRTLGPVVSAISASASSSSAWTLLGVSGAAYAWGISAIWLFPACVGGFILNWYVVAPRLQTLSHETNSLTLTEVIARDTPPKYSIAVVASIIIAFSLLFYISSQFQAAGKTFSATFDISYDKSVVIGGAIIIFYTLMGGFWAVSITDTLQGLLMAAAAIILPIAALVEVGGFSTLVQQLPQVDIDGYMSLTRNMLPSAAVGFVLGLLGIGLGYPGQPHVVNRFMALKDQKALIHARRIAILWAVCVYSGMILLGLCGRVLFDTIPDKEKIFFVATNNLFSPVIAGVMTACILSAIMSTADSQLLVAASSLTHDLRLHREKTSVKQSLTQARVVVFLLSIAAIFLAIFGTKEIFDRVLFAWTAMGAAFGPILIVRLLCGPITPRATLIAMLLGFTLSVVGYSIPATKGTYIDRILPFVLATVIAYRGTKK
ncbi:sodium/proline symporter [Candidatus Uabimicrobium amorphum]|uniref:Sodium/proline symporter n=1 Tax=Uabimicrobium amorphum TaxID=2596890 RepID=A0A5S9IJM7_UABAM|nr:sodium/proline symporter [Candidatus Uabimicrobium amorphum]BBM82750.1 sodium:proline symporter [Candidatus Uabimicrobium amorphum]